MDKLSYEQKSRIKRRGFEVDASRGSYSKKIGRGLQLFGCYAQVTGDYTLGITFNPGYPRPKRLIRFHEDITKKIEQEGLPKRLDAITRETAEKCGIPEGVEIGGASIVYDASTFYVEDKDFDVAYKKMRTAMSALRLSMRPTRKSL